MPVCLTLFSCLMDVDEVLSARGIRKLQDMKWGRVQPYLSSKARKGGSPAEKHSAKLATRRRYSLLALIPSGGSTLM